MSTITLLTSAAVIKPEDMNDFADVNRFSISNGTFSCVDGFKILHVKSFDHIAIVDFNLSIHGARKLKAIVVGSNFLHNFWNCRKSREIFLLDDAIDL
jgi:hypothetical protein